MTMNYDEKIHELTGKMIAFDAGDPKRIQHFIKVHSFAGYIGKSEGPDSEECFILESAALVHDIGIRPAEEKYQRCDGKIQEQVGPEYARRMLKELSYTEEQTDRVCFLVAHHHTYDNIEGIDYQILVEADLLVNMYEDEMSLDAAKSAYEKIFMTKTGKELCRTMYQL